MIEQVMIFLLGFLLAGLLALMIAPAFWRRALRLSRRHMEAQVPVSIQEILAERDQLRAQNAVECRRLEDKAAVLNRIHAADLQELGRRAAQIVTLEGELAVHRQDRDGQIDENVRLTRDLAEVRAEAAATQKALFDVDAAHKAKQEEAANLGQSLSAAAALAELRLASLTASDNYSRDVQRQLVDLRAELQATQARHKEKAREADELNDAQLSLRNDIAKLQKKLEAETARAVNLETTVGTLRDERKSDATELRKLGLKREADLADLHEARNRASELATRHAEQSGKMREREAMTAAQMHQLQSDHEALQGALDVARRRCDDLERELAQRRTGVLAASGPEAEGNLLLRQSISEIGAAMIKLAAAHEQPLRPAPALETAEREVVEDSPLAGR